MTRRHVQDAGDPALQSSVRLLNAAKENDSAAWQRLVSLYTPLVRHWLARLRVATVDRDDLIQEVFCSVARKIAEFRRDDATQSFRGWLRTITEHKVIDFRRTLSRRIVACGCESLQQTPSGMVWDSGKECDEELSHERRILFEQAVSILRTEFRDATWRMFWAVVIDGAAPHEVAAANGVQTNVVYLAKSRVLKRLREEFVTLIDN